MPRHSVMGGGCSQTATHTDCRHTWQVLKHAAALPMVRQHKGHTSQRDREAGQPFCSGIQHSPAAREVVVMLHVVLNKVVSESCLQPASCTWSRHSFVNFRQTQGPDGSHFIDFGISLIQTQCSIYSTQHSARCMSLMGRSVCKAACTFKVPLICCCTPAASCITNMLLQLSSKQSSRKAACRPSPVGGNQLEVCKHVVAAQQDPGQRG